MANVATASKEQVDWAIGVIDQAGEGEAVDGNDFFRASAVLTVVAYAAFELAEEVERLQAANAAYQDYINGKTTLAQLEAALSGVEPIYQQKPVEEWIEPGKGES